MTANGAKSAVMEAVATLCEPSWEHVTRRPLSGAAARLLSDLLGGKKLTQGVMAKHKDAVTELVTKGCIKLNIRKRDQKTGITPGSIQPRKILALADEMRERIETWRQGE